MAEFLDIVKERRSASNFLEGNPITKEELNNIFEAVKLAPSAFNLQHTRYITVLDANMKEKIRAAAQGQYKVASASAVILVVGNKHAYKQAGDIYAGLQMLGIVNKQEYDHLVSDTTAFYETRGTEFLKEEAIRNASLSAMLFMLAAKNQGWDTCPMIGLNQQEVRQLLQVPAEEEVVLMITIGKEKVESRQPRGYRKPVREFVTYVE